MLYVIHVARMKKSDRITNNTFNLSFTYANRNLYTSFSIIHTKNNYITNTTIVSS